jgi:hypothetical protein
LLPAVCCMGTTITVPASAAHQPPSLPYLMLLLLLSSWVVLATTTPQAVVAAAAAPPPPPVPPQPSSPSPLPPLRGVRIVEVGWKFFLSEPGYSGEYVAAAECSHSWEATRSALWQHETSCPGCSSSDGGLLRLVNSSLCLDNHNISRAGGRDVSALRLSACDAAAASQQWRRGTTGAANTSSSTAPLVSALHGRCLTISADNTTILASVHLAPCGGGSNHSALHEQQVARLRPDGRVLLGARKLCLEAASAVPHRRRRRRRRLLRTAAATGRSPPGSSPPSPSSPLLRAQALAFFRRLRPLLNATSGAIGVVVSAGWIMDLCTEWSGDPSQPYPIDNPEAPQFAHWTYAHIRTFFATLREAAAGRIL